MAWSPDRTSWSWIQGAALHGRVDRRRGRCQEGPAGVGVRHTTHPKTERKPALISLSLPLPHRPSSAWALTAHPPGPARPCTPNSRRNAWKSCAPCSRPWASTRGSSPSPLTRRACRTITASSRCPWTWAACSAAWRAGSTLRPPNSRMTCAWCGPTAAPTTRGRAMSGAWASASPASLSGCGGRRAMTGRAGGGPMRGWRRPSTSHRRCRPGMAAAGVAAVGAAAAGAGVEAAVGGGGPGAGGVVAARPPPRARPPGAGPLARAGRTGRARAARAGGPAPPWWGCGRGRGRRPRLLRRRPAPLLRAPSSHVL